jgi:hypothetical protein
MTDENDFEDILIALKTAREMERLQREDNEAILHCIHLVKSTSGTYTPQEPGDLSAASLERYDRSRDNLIDSLRKECAEKTAEIERLQLALRRLTLLSPHARTVNPAKDMANATS